MSGVIVCNPPGHKLGNAAMSWLHAYAHAQRVGAEFQCPPWIGEKVFDLPKYDRPAKVGNARGPAILPQRSEETLGDDETDVEIRGYAQNERAMIYTKRQAQEWLRPSHYWSVRFDDTLNAQKHHVVAHLRRGDYIGYGYPMVSLGSYDRCISTWRLNAHVKENFEVFRLVSELCPVLADIPDEISFFIDFMFMVRAKVLLRANSSFSWLAGLLCNGRVFAPLIDGKPGGIEHDCDFVEGNWPRLSELAGCRELRVLT